MKLDFSTRLLDLKNQPLRDGAEEVTLGGAVASALLAVDPRETTISGAVKAKRFQLALKVAAGGEQDVTIEELAEIKTLTGNLLPPLAVGRIYQILDGIK